MALLIVVVFILGYALIALEHPLKIDKAASALLTGVLCWLVLLFGIESMPGFASINREEFPDLHTFIDHSLFEHLGEIAGILFFLLGAMTIVELVDTHDGFKVITDRITSRNRVKLLWVISWVAFFLSALLDNLTTSIIMCALIRRLVKKKDNIWLLGGFVVIAANAGGAWSPIGDVTTIMLWIGGQITTFHVIQAVLAPSVVSLLAPLAVASYFLRGKVQAPEVPEEEKHEQHEWSANEQYFMFALGALGLLFVPVFKAITHFPPYMGVLLSVGFVWYVTEYMHRGKEDHIKHRYSVASMLHRIDTPSILFFLGILLAVGALDASGHLHLLAEGLDQTFGSIYIINGLIGVLSAIVDNVPLVAAAMGMYEMTEFPVDDNFWSLLAYCAGTGGSMLIIGSAAGVASMGILKIEFFWYIRNISLYALIGYLAGMLVFYLQHSF